MPRCEERGENTEGVDPYSTADYCETPDSFSMRQGGGVDCASSRHHVYHTPSGTRCLKKHYRMPPHSCHHHPRSSVSFPSRRFHRGGRRMRRNHHMEETTSMDERKSMTSYSSVMTVDVTREMEAVNRDIEEIIRRCDEFHVDNRITDCKSCCRRHKKISKMNVCSLTQEQMRILSMKRPPLDKLKEVPVSLLKPRPPRHSLKEKSLSVPKYKSSRDIRDIVEETDALLRNVYRELSRNKHLEARSRDEDGCHCDITRGVSDPRPATCLERFLGCQNKCRRFLENRWIKPKWKDVLQKGEMVRMFLPGDDRFKHFHDTNCISEPTTSSCLIRVKKECQEPSFKTYVKYKDTGVNTESHVMKHKHKLELNEKKTNTQISSNFYEDILDKDVNDRTFMKNDDMKRYRIDLQPIRAFANYTSDSSAKHFFKGGELDRRRSSLEEHQIRKAKNEEWNETKSLLLDRNMGLSLDGDSKMKLLDEKECVYDNSYPDRPVIPMPDNFAPSCDEDNRSNRKIGGGDTISALESSKSFISHIINKIVNRRIDLPPINLKMVSQYNLEKQDLENSAIDSSICLEIMRRLVDLMSRNDHNRVETMGEVPQQYTRVRQMKHEHLLNIEKEIKYIQDLEFYLVNASPARL